MTREEFSTAMCSLYSCDKSPERALRIIGQFLKSYGWLEVDDLKGIALECAARAERTYKAERGASRTTWFITIFRNACRSYVHKLATQFKRDFAIRDTASEDAVMDEAIDDVAIKDDLELMYRALSPLAWRWLQLIMSGEAGRTQDRVIADKLEISAQSVKLLKREVRSAAILLGMGG